MAKIQLLHLVAVRIRGVTGGRAHFLGRRKVPTMSHVLQQQTCFRKICFEHGGPKLVSCPGRHLTPFRPCRGPYGRRNHRHKSTKNGYPYSSSHYRIGVCIWPTLEEQKNFNSTYFLYAWFVYIAHMFYYEKAVLMRREQRNNAPKAAAVGLHPIIEEKW